MTEKPTTHLGDGAYAEWIGYALVLFTDNGLQRTNEVVLEREHIAALQSFLKELGLIA